MYKKVVWPIILVLSILLAIILGIGFFVALNLTAGDSTSTINENKNETVLDNYQNNSITEPKINNFNILILGDSIAVGSGDETGNGFKNGLKTFWEDKTDKDITINNLAVNGAKSADLLQVIERKESSLILESSDIIIISIGGNEIKMLKDMETTTLSSEFSEIKNTYSTNLKKIFDSIRDKNTTCQIIFIGLYNPFADKITENKVRLLNTWNFETEQILSYDPNSIFIPTYDLFMYNLDEYLTIDNFHPNSAGYSAISNRIVEVLKNQ